MSWSTGMALWLLGSGLVLWLWCAVMDRVQPRDEWDEVAETKRRNARKARHLSGEFK